MTATTWRWVALASLGLLTLRTMAGIDGPGDAWGIGLTMANVLVFALMLAVRARNVPPQCGRPLPSIRLVTEHPLTDQEVARIRQQFAELFPNNRSVVVDQAKLAVPRADERGSIEDQTTEDLT